MLPQRQLREVQPGDEILVEDHNDLVREVKRLQLIQGRGILIDQTEVGQVIKAILYGGLVRVDIPSGGIPAATADGSTPLKITPGSTDCIVGTFTNGQWVYNGTTRKVHNGLIGSAVAGPKIGYAIPSADGALHLVNLPC